MSHLENAAQRLTSAVNSLESAFGQHKENVESRLDVLRLKVEQKDVGLQDVQQQYVALRGSVATRLDDAIEKLQKVLEEE